MERHGRTLAIAVAYVGFYLLLSWWGKELASDGGTTPWFPPPGVTVPFVIALGARWIPLVFVAELLSAVIVFHADESFTDAQLIVNTCIVAGAYSLAPFLLIRLTGIHPALRRTRDIGWFVVFCVLAGPLLAALGGTGVRAWTDSLGGDSYLEGVKTWFVGDALGVVTLAPFLLMLLARQRPGGERANPYEMAAMMIALAVTPGIAFALDDTVPPQLAYISLLPLMWVALRHGITGAIAGVAVLNVATTIIARADLGAIEELTDLQAFMVVVAIVGLYVGCVVSERRRAEMTIRRRAVTDAVTDLPNRFAFLEWLDAALQTNPQDGRGPRPAVVLLDIDRFRVLNDVGGPEEGDRLLRTVGARLRAALREGDRIARLGADEFVVLTEDDGTGQEARATADRMKHTLDPALNDVRLTASAGVMVARPGDKPHQLLRGASVALGAARQHGPGRTGVLDAKLVERARMRRDLETDLPAAIEQGRLSLAYQPIHGLGTQDIRYEALLRWTHPVHGTTDTELVVSLAEESGDIVALGRWVQAEACRQAAAWAADGHDWSVSVNVSPRELLSAHFVDGVQEALASSGLDPAKLSLEVTESALIDDVERAVETLQALRKLGCGTVIDDFGTGYCSLTWLERLPIDEVKLDRAFVARASAEPRSQSVVASIIELAHGLGLRVIAEGVETVEQQELLAWLGCDAIQGWLVGKPLPADKLPTPESI